jgi:hypothetical protein
MVSSYTLSTRQTVQIKHESLLVRLPRVLHKNCMHNSFPTDLHVQLNITLWKYDIMLFTPSGSTFPILSPFNYTNPFLSSLKQIFHSRPYYISTLCDNITIIMSVDNHSKEQNLNYGQMYIYFKNICLHIFLCCKYKKSKMVSSLKAS